MSLLPDWVRSLVRASGYSLTKRELTSLLMLPLDHQWIHVDTERAAVESQFKSTIAHGYLTLSLLPHMWQEIIEVNTLR